MLEGLYILYRIAVVILLIALIGLFIQL